MTLDPCVALYRPSRYPGLAGLATFALALTLTGRAVAEPDGRVQGLNSAAFQVLGALPNRPWGQREALILATALWKDGKLDSAEKDLLEELTRESATPRQVEVSGESGGQPLQRTTAANWAQVMLLWAQLPSELRKRSWEESFEPFTAYSRESSANERQITSFLTLDLARFYIKSNFANSYRPFKLRLQTMVERADALPTADGKQFSRVLIYRAAEHLDRLEGGSVQDFFYKELEPKPTTPTVTLLNCSSPGPQNYTARLRLSPHQSAPSS